MELRNRSVVITGAGRGLGRALLHSFIDAGSCVTGFVRDESVASELTSKIDSKRLLILSCDVGDPLQVQRCFDNVKDHFGAIDVLINNAAIYRKVSFVEETSAQWQEAIDASVNGVAYCCKHALTHMIKAEFGRIYNVGSWAHLGPIEKSAAYSASKAAVHALTKAIALDVAVLDLDIRVHEWLPGHLNTRMSDFTGIAPEFSAEWAVDIVRNDCASQLSSIFENNYEWSPPKRLKDRILGVLLLKDLRKGR